MRERSASSSGESIPSRGIIIHKSRRRYESSSSSSESNHKRSRKTKSRKSKDDHSRDHSTRDRIVYTSRGRDREVRDNSRQHTRSPRRSHSPRRSLSPRRHHSRKRSISPPPLRSRMSRRSLSPTKTRSRKLSKSPPSHRRIHAASRSSSSEQGNYKQTSVPKRSRFSDDPAAFQQANAIDSSSQPTPPPPPLAPPIDLRSFVAPGGTSLPFATNNIYSATPNLSSFVPSIPTPLPIAEPKEAKELFVGKLLKYIASKKFKKVSQKIFFIINHY